MWKNCRRFIRAPLLLGLFGIMIVIAGGCKKSEPADADSKAKGDHQSPIGTYPSQVVAQIHWLGKKRLATETNAAGVTRIWNLPESLRLEIQTLDKLSLSLSGMKVPANTNSQSPITNYSAFVTNASALLRPLLQDIVQEESVLEIADQTNQPLEFVLAIKLNLQQAELWRTNLAAALESLTGSKAVPSKTPQSFEIKLARPASPITHHVTFASSGDWTLVSFAASQNLLLDELRRRIERNHAPFPSPTSNFWLEIQNLDCDTLARAVGLHLTLADNLPKIFLSIAGDGENVRTSGYLSFPNALNLNLDQWNIPTNLISQPLVSFTALRGFGPWLSSLKIWSDLAIGLPANQLYMWAQDVPFQTYFAAPQSDASNQVSRLTDFVLHNGASFFATHDIATFERSPTFNGLQWTGLPVMTPFLQSLETTGGNFIFGGLFPLGDTNLPPPAELLQQVLGPTNQVCYDWELTGPRIDQWISIGNFLRFAGYRKQMSPDLAAQAWLKTASLKLGNCGTIVRITAQNQLSFVRKSSLGFTAFELHLLADWLESPDFPHGLHSTLSAPLDLPMAPPEKSESQSPQTSPSPKK